MACSINTGGSDIRESNGTGTVASGVVSLGTVATAPATSCVRPELTTGAAANSGDAVGARESLGTVTTVSRGTTRGEGVCAMAVTASDSGISEAATNGGLTLCTAGLADREANTAVDKGA